MDEFGDDLRKRPEKKDGSPKYSAEEVPSLQVAGVDFASAAKGALNDILILIVLNVAFFMGAFMVFLRYDVR